MWNFFGKVNLGPVAEIYFLINCKSFRQKAICFLLFQLNLSIKSWPFSEADSSIQQWEKNSKWRCWSYLLVTMSGLLLGRCSWLGWILQAGPFFILWLICALSTLLTSNEKIPAVNTTKHKAHWNVLLNPLKYKHWGNFWDLASTSKNHVLQSHAMLIRCLVYIAKHEECEKIEARLLKSPYWKYIYVFRMAVFE